MATATKSKSKSKSASKKAGRPAKNVVTASLAATIAKLRREGGTWADCDDAAGFHRSSTGWREELDAHGYDKFGRKNGQGKSKAKGWDSSSLDGVGASKPKASSKKSPGKGGKKRVVRRTKATAKK